MNLYQIRGGTIEELYRKEYQIGVGISLGNKWFTIDNITDLVHWSLQHTKDLVIIYVADYIHSINIEVRTGKSREKSIEVAERMGEEVLEQTRSKLLSVLSKDDFKRVVFAKWNELVDESYLKKLEYLKKKYKTDMSFKKDIESIVINFTKDEVRKFSDEQINKLGEYIIEELPECICRVKIAGHECDGFVYPYDGELPVFIEKIQNAEIYPEIRENILDTKPKVFITVR